MSSEPIKELQGATLIRAVAVGDDEIVMVTSDGLEVTFYHAQDCCETVTIEDVNGDWEDLIGTPLLVAEERTDRPDTLDNDYDSVTYTFYTFRTIKGSVDVRWCGTSNGYYSEAVNMKTRKLDFKGVCPHESVGDLRERSCVVPTPESKVKSALDKMLKAERVWFYPPQAGPFGSAGIPDRVAVVDGLFVGIECKADATKKPTALQIKCMADIEAAGGKCFVVYDKATIEQVREWIHACRRVREGRSPQTE